MASKDQPLDDHNCTPSKKTWLFGPDWSGRRCGAKTRSGKPCQKPALKHNARCQIHGGRGGAPAGERNGNYRTGEYTKQTLREKREAFQRIRELVAIGKQIGMFD
ncbi:HGGxSTG domain-containing protein [Phyllobacterium endophyticum]|uniref:Uncharacterized protein n=1 Tax=Phyllobacterium endophyticum TaxID=1149773 RepID=A0A2P7AYR1_9HYPH|nr:HGGxSTG domain-containing protein [Phyllobacterium endophyticum]MBB3236133.1 hypothetical protein [Phyllobacterium endophyticum]PSH59314.1 hypothetical protein CU100_00465 [Phyllobacterium endophyticum]TYR41439.1 hypothetical protein FY050_09115 [Phyllobacterium endophyticum]